MRITQIQLQNIGVFENETIIFKEKVDIDKAEVHILTGTNGTGKSTLLKALAAAFEETVVNKDNAVVCTNNTNTLTKYLRINDERSRAKICIADKSVSDYIEYTGCPNGAEHLHVVIRENETFRPHKKENNKDTSYNNVQFAYSSYRSLSFSEELPDNVIHNANPFYQILEFNKKPNAAFTVDTWIRDSLLKRAYAQNKKHEPQLSEYTDIIKKIENAVSELAGFSIVFDLDNKYRTPLICYNNQKHELDVLPDGLKSIIGWLSDLCMRLEAVNWSNNTPVFERNIILFLDEIEIHLHPEWQRKVLPVVQKLFPHAQIFISTHSPFVVASVDNAWVYRLALENGNAKVAETYLSDTGKSYQWVLDEIFGVKSDFAEEIERRLASFYAHRNELLQHDFQHETLFLEEAASLAQKGIELRDIVGREIRQLNRVLKKEYTL